MDEANEINVGLKKLETEVVQKNSGINVGATNDALDNYSDRIRLLESNNFDPDAIEDLKQVVDTVRKNLKESSVFGGRSKRRRSVRSKRRRGRSYKRRRS